MEYNRALNAVIIGYILTFVLLAASVAVYATGERLGAVSGLLAVISLAAAYYHEHLLMAADEILKSALGYSSAQYRKVFRLYSVAAITCPVSLVAGYVIVFSTLIAGV